VSKPALWPTQPPVQWVPGVLSQGLKRGRGLRLITHPHLQPRMSRSYISSLLKRFRGVYWDNFRFRHALLSLFSQTFQGRRKRTGSFKKLNKHKQQRALFSFAHLADLDEHLQTLCCNNTTLQSQKKYACVSLQTHHIKLRSS
jgi:hypothetical protein